MMNSDGTEARQITFFNTPGTDEYALVGGRRTISNYIEWHPTKRQMIGSVTISKGSGQGFEEKIFLIELEEGD